MALLLRSGTAPLPPPEAPPIAPVEVATGLAGRDSVRTAMLRSTVKSNGMCGALEKLGLDFANSLRLRRAMSEGAETRRETIRRLFYLITIAAEDAAVLAVEGQSGRLSSDHARTSAARLREMGIRIEILSSAITELLEGRGQGGETA
jgi:hypothetical protein